MSAHLKLVQLHQKLTQEISPALFNRCKRQLAVMVAMSWGIACVLFGIGFCADYSALTCLRVGFGTFWMAWGVSLIVSTLVIADWLGKNETAD